MWAIIFFWLKSYKSENLEVYTVYWPTGSLWWASCTCADDTQKFRVRKCCFDPAWYEFRCRWTRSRVQKRRQRPVRNGADTTVMDIGETPTYNSFSSLRLWQSIWPLNASRRWKPSMAESQKCAGRADGSGFSCEFGFHWASPAIDIPNADGIQQCLSKM